MEIPGDQLKTILRKTFCRIPPATVMIFYKIMSNDMDFFFSVRKIKEYNHYRNFNHNKKPPYAFVVNHAILVITSMKLS